MAARAGRRSPRALSAGDVVREFLGRGAGNLLRFDPVARRHRDPEGIHQMRVNVRHLRSELRVTAPVLRSSEREGLDRELKWLGRGLGRLRDLDVLGDLFAAGAAAGVPTPRLVSSHLTAQRDAEAARVDRVLDSARYRRLLSRLSAAVLAPPLRASHGRSAAEVLSPGLRQVASDFAAAVERLGPSPSPEELHLVRIKAKRARYNCELATTFLPSAKRAASALEKVQTALGDLHDHVVAREYLRGVVRPHEMFGGPPLDDATFALIEWFDSEIARLSGSWSTPVAVALDALGPVKRSLHINSSDAPEVPVK